MGKEQCKLERHLGYDYSSSSEDLMPEATVYKSVEDENNRLTAKSVLAGTKLILFGRYVLNISIGIV